MADLLPTPVAGPRPPDRAPTALRRTAVSRRAKALLAPVLLAPVLAVAGGDLMAAEAVSAERQKAESPRRQSPWDERVGRSVLQRRERYTELFLRTQEAEIELTGRRPNYIERIYFTRDPATGKPIETPSPRPELGRDYFWQGTAFWLAVEVEGVAFSGWVCATWRGPNDAVWAQQRQRLPVAERRLIFSAPDTELWPVGRYRLELAAGEECERAFASVRFGIGERLQKVGLETPRFPWPPPRPSTRALLPGEALGDNRRPRRLGEAADRLLRALRAAGYGEHSFYGIPGGFALATRLEQIESDGTPRPEPERWSAAPPVRRVFSLTDFLKALFLAPEGHYRVIVFAVTDQPASPDDTEPTAAEARAWLGSGLLRLPEEIERRPYTRAHDTIALIYQFRQVGHEGRQTLSSDEVSPARTQLQRSGLLGR